MSSRLLTQTARELAHGLLFSLVVSIAAGAIGLVLWSANISLVQADVAGDFAAVAVAAFCPAFFGAWSFFLLRRLAWSGSGEAVAVAGAVSGLAVLAHHNVLASTFFSGQPGDLANQWILAAAGLLPREGAVDGTLAAEVAVVVGASVVCLLIQRQLSRPRRA
jgi:hypothetical protein